MKHKPPLTLNQLREVNPCEWELCNTIISSFYRFFRSQGYFTFQEMAFGLEGSYEIFEHFFDSGDYVFQKRPLEKGVMYTICIWNEIKEDYEFPKGGNSIVVTWS